ncbi:hypothetical protein I3215_04435 [Streptomyces sp. RB110-1]|uniref:hypothetical protein n=1 Tax=unclassified Streptomyces TaxID=2593676 RepID=UPI0019022CE6|nr:MULTISPECIES: hypothetical protein [unclassified Streptomyces]MBK0372150.1 hypothetical protein [Streptomyces sp. RB110-1]MBK0385133.1 hypothetical protein [Streptomyces sp. RB110-2]
MTGVLRLLSARLRTAVHASAPDTPPGTATNSATHRARNSAMHRSVLRTAPCPERLRLL